MTTQSPQILTEAEHPAVPAEHKEHEERPVSKTHRYWDARDRRPGMLELTKAFFWKRLLAVVRNLPPKTELLWDEEDLYGDSCYVKVTVKLEGSSSILIQESTQHSVSRRLFSPKSDLDDELFMTVCLCVLGIIPVNKTCLWDITLLHRVASDGAEVGLTASWGRTQFTEKTCPCCREIYE